MDHESRSCGEAEKWKQELFSGPSHVEWGRQQLTLVLVSWHPLRCKRECRNADRNKDRETMDPNGLQR